MTIQWHSLYPKFLICGTQIWRNQTIACYSRGQSVQKATTQIYSPSNTHLRTSTCAYYTDITNGLRAVQNKLFTVCKSVEQTSRVETPTCPLFSMPTENVTENTLCLSPWLTGSAAIQVTCHHVTLNRLSTDTTTGGHGCLMAIIPVLFSAKRWAEGAFQMKRLRSEF